MKKILYSVLLFILAITISISLSGCFTMGNAAQAESYEQKGDFKMAIWYYSLGFAYDDNPDEALFNEHLSRIKETVGAGDELNQYLAYSINGLVEDMRKMFMEGDLQGMQSVNHMGALQILSSHLPEELQEEALKGL